MSASIKIDKTVPPVRQSYRRIPIPLEEVTILKLKELERQDVIERVYEASEWISPMLVKRKSLNDVRIIIDLREANKAVVREVHPLPTMEQMMAKLRGSTVFGKLDIKQASFPPTSITRRLSIYHNFYIAFGSNALQTISIWIVGSTRNFPEMYGNHTCRFSMVGNFH